MLAHSQLEMLQAIRPYLPELLNAPMAQQIDYQLDELIASSRIEPALEALSKHDASREWLRLYAEGQLAVAEILPHMRKYHPLMDSPNTIESPHYVCPVASCHQEWYRQDQAQAIPRCPIHDVGLVRESKLQTS